jgi:hypothetical protein
VGGGGYCREYHCPPALGVVEAREGRGGGVMGVEWFAQSLVQKAQVVSPFRFC